MAINFPDAPANGATYTVGSTTWTYYSDATSWRTGTGVISGFPTTIAVQNTTGTATASGSNSISIGATTSTISGNSISIGVAANTTGVGSISVGANAAVSGNTSLAVGVNANTSSISGVAVGANSVVTGNNSIAVGAGANSAGVNSIAIGVNTISGGNNATVVGFGSQATAAFAMALGANVTSSTANTIVIGTNTNFTIIPGGVTLSQSSEVLNILTGATGVVAHDFSTGSIFYHTSPAANFTANFTNVPTTDNRTNIVTLVIIQGTTPYYPNAVQIGNVAQTIKWIGGSAPTATANRTEIVSFTLVRQSGLWTVLGSLTSYG